MKITNGIRMLVLGMACSMLLGCSGISVNSTAEEPTDIRIAENSCPEPTVAVTLEPEEPTPKPVETALQPTTTPTVSAADAAVQLSTIDLEVFVDYVTTDGYTLQRCLINPSDYGIQENELMQSWGSFTEDAAVEKGEWAAERLAELQRIDREQLTERDRLSYDTLEQYLLGLVDKAELFFYQEPLTPEDGVQVSVPLMLSQYRLETKEDVESYLLLIQDTPRYFSELLAQQQQRAERGLFMTKDALDAVLRECSEIIGNEKDLYIKDVFEDSIDDIEESSRKERKDYIERHNAVINDSLIPAYELLQDGLRLLSENCRSEQGMYVLGESAMKQYAHMLAQEAASDITPEDALLLLDTALADLYETMHAIYADDPTVESHGQLSGKTTVSKLLQELRTFTEQMLPSISENTVVTATEVSKTMADVIPAARSVAPPIDREEGRFEILLNPRADDDMLFLTLAHEGWPGHLYQFIYQHNLAGLGLLQQALPLNGYYEGWAQMAEEWLLLEQTKYDQNAAMFAFSNGMLSDAIIPSVVSILVNYYGYERDDVRDYLAQYGLQEDAYVDLYYDCAVSRPYSALRYGVGYAQYAELMRDMSAVLGENYLQKNVQVRYLDYGPSYFHLIRERMDEWADTKMPE